MIRYFLPKELSDLKRATDESSGYDLQSTDSLVIQPGERVLVGTNLYLSMPSGVEAQVRSRSGMASKHGVIVLNAPGTVDADYRGEVMVLLANTGTAPHGVSLGDRIAQLVFAPVLPDFAALIWDLPVDRDDIVNHFQPKRVYSRGELGQTERGDGGHGSTGR